MFDLSELGETSPAQQHQEGKLVSPLGLSLLGGGGRHWVWAAESRPAPLGILLANSSAPKVNGVTVTSTWRGLRDESLQLSLCRKHRKNYRSCFIGSGSRGLNELSKATQRACGKADGTSWALSALRGSSQTTLCFKGSHSTTLWLVYMFKWKTNCSIFVFICTSNICPDF